MKVKTVILTSGELSLAVQQGTRWIPLVPALEIHEKGPGKLSGLKEVAGDMITFLGDKKYRDMAYQLIDEKDVAEADFQSLITDKPVLPFKPLSYRDFMLYEQHYINAVKGMLKKFIPGKYRFISFYEKLFKKPPKAAHPKALWYKAPIYYMGNHLSFVPENTTITFPSYATVLDYELELGIILTKPLFNAAPEQAGDAIGGVCIFNDFSARNMQIGEMDSGFGPVKTKNFANSMSGVVVTADEIMDRINNLTTKVYINNELKSSGTTAGMKFSLEEAAAYASLGEQIYPGEFFGSGTIPNCSGIETGCLLKPGDVLRLEVEKIGALTNTIAKAASHQPG